MAEDIILDPSIRDWVVLPMVVVMVLVGLLRHYVSLVITSEKPVNKDEMKHMQALQRSQRLRANANFLQPSAFETRKHYFVANEKEHGVNGILREKVQANPMNNPMMNPNGMMDMMKGNMAFMIPNLAMMGLISYFFAGFVLVKVPFSLTVRFKEMLQRGIEFDSLDVSYVSSLSWYFLVMFGMRGFLSLLLGEKSASDADESKALQMQMGMGGGPNVGFDASKAFKQERDNLQLYLHEWSLEHIERRFLGEEIPMNLVEASSTTLDERSKSSSKYTKTPRKHSR